MYTNLLFISFIGMFYSFQTQWGI